MNTFDADGLLSQHPERLTGAVMEALAEQLAAFHQSIASTTAAGELGSPEAVLQPMLDNFSQLEHWVADTSQILPQLSHLRHWTLQQFEHLSPLLIQRKEAGFIRECHGDLHLGNITLDDGRPLIFDGIEFNPSLRWIDVASELAFLVMDLDERDCSGLGYHFLNRYLEISGDYALLPLLRFYQVYRAMVRAKVTAIRLAQMGSGAGQAEEQVELSKALNDYLVLAEGYTKLRPAALILTHGFSGSGKSWYCRNQLQGLPAVVVRSDVERKRLAGLTANQSSASELDGGIYQADFSQRTYDHLLACAKQILQAGLVAVIDAAFLAESKRKLFIDYVESQSLPILILDFDLPEQTLRNRIQQRLAQGGDPSEAGLSVLQNQLNTAEPLTQSERSKALRIAEQQMPDIQHLIQQLGLSVDTEAQVESPESAVQNQSSSVSS